MPDGLIVRTVRTADPGDLLDQLPGPAASAWIQHGDGLVGWGEAARLTLPAGVDRFAAGEKWLAELFETASVADEVAAPGTGPVAFGSFTFDPASDGSVLVVPATVLGRSDGRAWLTTIEPAGRSAARPGRPGGPGGSWRSGRADRAPATLPAPAPPVMPTGVRWADGSLTAPQWERAVAAAVSAISEGRLRKVVLALELNATTAADIDERVLLSRLAGRYEDCYTFACDGLVGATPELLIRRTDSELYSLVLAGTMPRGGSPETDRALGAALLASAKDQEEHQYVVADVRAALQPLCADLQVEAQPSLLRLAN